MGNAGNPIQRLYSGFVRAVSSLQSPFLLVVRVYWGWQISQNGWGKLHNLPHVTEFFASLGLPAPALTAAFVSSFEFLAGILLALGLLSRIVALGLVIDMTMAYLTADRESFLAFFSNPGKFLRRRSVYLSIRRPANINLRAGENLARYSARAIDGKRKIFRVRRRQILLVLMLCRLV